jgi:uncharacterized membrane protein YciS (DUF1049 family)
MNFIKSVLHFIRTILATLLLIALIVFMIANRQTIEVSTYPLPYTIETRMFMVMIVCFLFGLLFGVLLCSKNLIKRIFENFQSRRKIKKLEEQIEKK